MVLKGGDASLQEEFDAGRAVGRIGEDQIETGFEAGWKFEAQVGEVGPYVPAELSGGLVYEEQQAFIDIDDGDRYFRMHTGQGQTGQIVIAETEDFSAGQIVGFRNEICPFEQGFRCGGYVV